MVFHTNVKSNIFKLPLNLSLTHLRAQIACYGLKGDLGFKESKELLHESFENFEISRICMENHASVTGWQKLFFSYKCFHHALIVSLAGQDKVFIRRNVSRVGG